MWSYGNEFARNIVSFVFIILRDLTPIIQKMTF